MTWEITKITMMPPCNTIPIQTVIVCQYPEIPQKKRTNLCTHKYHTIKTSKQQLLVIINALKWPQLEVLHHLHTAQQVHKVRCTKSTLQEVSNQENQTGRMSKISRRHWKSFVASLTCSHRIADGPSKAPLLRETAQLVKKIWIHRSF